MKLPFFLAIPAIVGLLLFVLGCSQGVKITGSENWHPGNTIGHQSTFKTGQIKLISYECCEEVESPSGIGWLGTGIAENTTENNITKLGFRFQLLAKDSVILGYAESNRVDLRRGQKAKITFDLNDIDYDEIESIGSIDVRWWNE